MPKSEISAPYNKHSGYMREPNEKNENKEADDLWSERGNRNNNENAF